MKVKSFGEWLKEQKSNFTFETAYKAGIEEMRKAHEDEVVALGEYYDQKMRRLSGINLEDATKLADILKQFPKYQERIPDNFQELSDQLISLVEGMRGRGL